jgi:hypothetical protein
MATRHENFASAATRPQPGFLVETWQFLSTTKKWWLTPIIVVLVAVGVLIALAGTAAAPFIYTLF